MKKLALLGISNCIINHGFGKIIKKKLKDNAYVYGIGSCPSMEVIFKLLQNDIINKYEYVVIDFCMIDTQYLARRELTPPSIVSWLLYIIKMFNDSKSTPIFLILPNLAIPFFESSSYIYKTVAQIFNISCIDFEEKFNLLDDFALAPLDDQNHFYAHYQEVIAESIINETAIKKLINWSRWEILINFYTYGLDKLKYLFPYTEKRTSLLNKEVVKFQIGNEIIIPDNSWCCGISYWCEKNSPYLSCKNSALFLTKNLNLPFDGFFSRPINALCRGGGGGGKLFLTHQTAGSFFEPGNCPIFKPPDGISNYLYIHDILLCDINPYLYGELFLNKFKEIFITEREELVKKASIRMPYSHFVKIC